MLLLKNRVFCRVQNRCFPSFFKLTPSPVFTQLWANKKRLTVDIHMLSFKMVGLHKCEISDESTESTKSYSNFLRDAMAHPNWKWWASFCYKG